MYGPPRYTFGSGGTIEIDSALCVGCGLCVRACPTGRVLEVFELPEGRRGARVANGRLCPGCGYCVPSCPKGALLVSRAAGTGAEGRSSC